MKTNVLVTTQELALAIQELAESTAVGFIENEKHFQKIEGDICTMKTDIGGLKFNVSDLQSDVAQLKSDVQTLKSDVAQLKSDVQTLKSDVAELKSDVSAIKISLEQIIKILMSQTVSRTEVRELDHRVIRLEHHLKLV